MTTPNRHLLYLGYCVDKETAHSLSGISIAGNNMQLSIIKRLHSDGRLSTSFFTVYPVAAFPGDKKLCYTKSVIPVMQGVTALRASFINIPVIKQTAQALSLYKNAKTILRSNPDAVILSYNAYPQTGMPSAWLKRKYPGCLFTVFLADLPIDENPARGIIGRFIYKRFYRKTEENILKADKLVVLNKHAAQAYAPGKPYIVVEGGVEPEDAGNNLNTAPVAQRDKIIVFSGRLVEYNGIMNLLDAMSMVKTKDVKLHIYGSGLIKDKVSKRIKQLKNAEYKGITDNDTMKRIQREAYLLINPRPVDEPIAMVTFPSKIFEYLISGTPVLTTRLNGFTEEYYDKMFFAETNKPGELACKIDEIMAMPPGILDKMAQSAREFVLKEKNWDKQMQKVIGFITENAGMSGQ